MSIFVKNQHIHTLLLCFFMAIGVSGVMGQSASQYAAGKLLLRSGELLEGNIRYRQVRYSPKWVEFKPFEGGPSTVYTPLEVERFEIEDKIFVGAIVEKEVSSVNDRDLEYSPSYSLDRDTLFLRALVEGARSLYMDSGAGGRFNFFVWENEDYVLLKYRRYIQNERANGEKIVAEQRGYIGQLLRYMAACPEIGDRIRGATYDFKEIRSLFESFYACLGEEPPYIALENSLGDLMNLSKEKSLRFSLGPIAGFRQTTVSREYLLEQEEFKDLTFEPHQGLIYGIYLDTYLFRQSRRWALHLEWLRGEYQYNSEQQVLPNVIQKIDAQYRFRTINAMVRYRIIDRDYFLFVQGGFSSARDVPIIDQEIRTNTNTNIEAITRNRLFNGPYTGQLNIIGAGLGYKNFWAELRVTPQPVATERISVIVGWDLVNIRL